MIKQVLLLACCCFFALSVSAQNSLNQAWEALFQNQVQTSRAMLVDASKKADQAENALLSLSLLAESDQSADQAFDYIQQFYNTAKNPEPYLQALWSSYALRNRGYIKGGKELAFYNALLQRNDVDGTLTALAQSAIGKHYERSKKYALADKAYQQIGSLDNWSISGEFENISTSGFDKDYETLLKPQADAVFTGKNGRKFAWRPISVIRHDKWFDFTYYSNYGDAILFAQTFVKSPKNITAQLRVGVSGSVKVWVNDQLLISESDERNNDLDSYLSTVKLNEGYNRILVQIGESYAGRSNFLIRLTDEQGKPLPQLSSVNTPQSYQKETEFKPTAIRPAVVKYFEDLLAKDPDNYLNRVLLAKAQLRSDNPFEARKALEPLMEKFPTSTFLNSLYIELFNREDNRTGIETAQEAIKVNDPDSSYGLDLLFAEYIRQADLNNAEATLKKLEKIWGEDQNVMEKKITLADNRKNQEEIVALIEKAYPLFPHWSYIVSMKYFLEKELKKNNQAISYLKKYVDEHDDYEMSEFMAKAYLDKGDAQAGLNVYLEEIKNDPVAVGIYVDLAEQYYKQQQYDKAEKTYLQAIALAPSISSYFASLGHIYEMSKKNDQALKAYEQSLQLKPNNYEAIRALRKIQQKKDVFDYFEQPDVRALIAKAPKLADYPDDHSIILNEETQRVVYEHGGSEEKHFYITKILTQKGLERIKEYRIPYFNSQELNVEVAETIKANGTKVPAEQDGGTIVFTNLEVGDVVNLRYKLQNFNTGSLAAHFWDSYYFTHGGTYLQNKYSLLIHRGNNFKYLFSQKEVPMTKTAKDEFDLYVWSAGNQEALIYEDKMPPMDDVANVLYLSSIPDWKFVANWYNNIATAKARSSYEIKSVVDGIFKGKEKLDPLAKVKLIYSYITQNISYSSVSFRQSGIVPQKPSTVINTRIGDCKDVSTLFVSMCKEAGIDAELLLVRTRDNGEATMLLPSIDFNHCIAKAKIAGKSYYVELTSEDLPFASFANASLRAPVLEINNQTSSITKLESEVRPQNNLKYSTTVNVQNSDMKIREESYSTGWVASSLRGYFNHLSNKDQIKKLKESIATTYPEAEVNSLVFTNLNPADAVSDTLKAVTEYALNNVCKPLGGMRIFSLPWSMSTKASQLQVLQPRHFGIDLNQLFYAENCVEEMTVILPEGTKLVEAYKPLQVSNDYLDYVVTSKQVGNKLLFRRAFKLKKDFVPAAKAEEFKQFFTKIADIDQQQLAFK